MRTRTYELNVKKGSMNVRAVECAITYSVRPVSKGKTKAIVEYGVTYENESENNDINLANQCDGLRSGRVVRSEIDHREPDGGRDRLRCLRNQLQRSRVHTPVIGRDRGDEPR